ncbi:MAG: 4-(cytidine 5'-diphospho)-2-C-methyl-D-erythritol kinase [Methylococcaceae bacterium]|nr:4-(cytidine 5'-diphospho)-2-C-methyl-D-erythritol kinase [Methylococcaceae bacterium]
MDESEVMRLPAPAKLNLMLRVVGRREDGYHLLQTVFQFIDRCDWITLRPIADGKVRLKVTLPGVPEESDLTVRAAMALKAAAGISKGVLIEVEKNLPMGGGLGGGSSDAATTLLGLNQLWGAGLSLDELKGLGLRLGADVPVFIDGCAAWAEGVGELLTPLDLSEPWYVVIAPRSHVATADVFRHPDLTRNNPPITIRDFLEGHQDNHCLPVVVGLYPEVAEAIADMSQYSPGRLTGTGACVFAEFGTEEAARQAVEALSPKWTVFAARGLNESPLRGALS